MGNFEEQFEQIKTLISSTTKSEKSFAYSTLQHLQEQSSFNSSLITLIIDSIQSIIPSIITDIQDVDSDEEILTLALKCLGFMIYHPSIVVAIPKDYLDRVLQSLARLITTTRIKLVCNLGVWCISIQQLDASSLVSHFDSLLMAIVHALDNPVGSLSTTFEAIQAVMKLATQISEKMRDSSSAWAPPIYRRLLSGDKREREMSIRCLLKIKSVIVPPPLALSKAMAQDMKLRLLPGMKELLEHGKKVLALQAWGWFVCILGSYSLKTRHLVNDLLKLPEQTFSDRDPQIQIASLVAWESVIDALVNVPSKKCGVVTIDQPRTEHNKAKSVDPSEEDRGIVRTVGYLKSLKLIMKPLIGIMESKVDLSVQSSCLSTWSYLLHELDSLVNDPLILGIVVEPMFQVVFSIGLEDRNIWFWKFCTNLLQDFIEAKSASAINGTRDHVNDNLSARTSDGGSPVSGEYSLKTYSVKWLSWDCSQTDFFIRVLQMICNQAAAVTLSLENRKLVSDTVLRLFHSFLKGVQIDFAKSSTNYDTVTQSMKGILMFVKTISEAATHGDVATGDFQDTCLKFIEAATQELDSSILASPLYKVALDLKYTSDLQSASKDCCKMPVHASAISFMDMVPPVVYLTVLYFSVGTLCILPEAYSYFRYLLSAFDSMEVLNAVVTLLYLCIENESLLVWMTVVKALKDFISDAKDPNPLKLEPASAGSLTVCHLLLHPFVLCSSQKHLTMPRHCNSLKASPLMSENLAFEQVTELWASLYCLVNSTHQKEPQRMNLFAEDLCSSLHGFLQRVYMTENVGEAKASDNSEDQHLLSVCGNAAKCILESLHVQKVTPEAIKCGYTGSSSLSNCLEFSAWFLKLLWTKNREAPINGEISRLLPSLTHFVGCLQWQEDTVSVFKVFRDPLLFWLSDKEMNCDKEMTKHNPQLLWIEIIKTLQHSWPAIVFDSSFLKLQAPLLEKTLDHPNPSISEPTITFWNSVYGDQTNLDFPPCLVEILDKLSRLGKTKTKNRSIETNIQRHRFKVTATLHTCSKRVELLESMMDGPSKNHLPPYPKRKKSELTEHQKEVRRAQQGKGTDCSGHGPGIRTYTSVDFSQGNDDSQDSQDLRDPELILDLRRRAT